jgi:hypothetical protein
MPSRFTYLTGEEVLAGDRVLYHGEPGEIEFVIAEPTGDPAMDWYLTLSPGGGIMISGAGMGACFLDEVDEDLEFVRRPTG